jgi:protein required for attachment to host cells
MKYKSVWALTAIGERAKIIKYIGMESKQVLIDIQGAESKIGDLKAVHGGFTFALMGKSRTGLELHSDPVRNRERIFAESIAAYLEEAKNRGEIGSLLIAASPRTLGDLRTAFSADLLKRVVIELDEEYTDLSENELVVVFNSESQKHGIRREN